MTVNAVECNKVKGMRKKSGSGRRRRMSQEEPEVQEHSA
jgi:hypothetical protein